MFQVAKRGLGPLERGTEQFQPFLWHRSNIATSFALQHRKYSDRSKNTTDQPANALKERSTSSKRISKETKTEKQQSHPPGSETKGEENTKLNVKQLKSKSSSEKQIPSES
jgi:hypothetical protein